MNEVEKNMAVEALAQLLDQQPTAYAEVLAACRAMGWNASPTAQPADIIDELPSNVLPFIRRMLALLIYGDGSADSPAVVPVTERCYAQMVPRVASPNYPAAGFPSDRDPFTHAPSIRDFAHLEQALSALSARKITNGGAPSDGIPDGMSLARLLGAGSSATKLIDDSPTWDLLTAARKSAIFTCLPSLSKVKLNCKRLSGYDYSYQEWFPNTVEDLQMDELERFEGSAYIGFPSVNPNYKVWSFPKLKYSRMSFSHSYNSLDSYVNDWTEEVYMPEMVEFGGYASNICLCNFTALETLTLGTPYTGGQWLTGDTALVNLRFTKEIGFSFNLSGWSPTLDSSNLDQFLQNFRSHTLKRLQQMTSSTTKTLTLSAGVYRAVYGLDSSDNVDPTSAAQTLSLGDLGVTEADLNEIEVAAGITTSTKYASWLSTYRAAIYWNIAK